MQGASHYGACSAPSCSILPLIASRTICKCLSFLSIAQMQCHPHSCPDGSLSPRLGDMQLGKSSLPHCAGSVHWSNCFWLLQAVLYDGRHTNNLMARKFAILGPMSEGWNCLSRSLHNQGRLVLLTWEVFEQSPGGEYQTRGDCCTWLRWGV